VAETKFICWHYPSVPQPRILKILLVEDDLEDEELLSEALLEIEERRQWCNWRSASIVSVGLHADAIHCLQRDLFDIVLLNLSLPDSSTLLDSFLSVHTNANGVPVVVLADDADENLAHRLLREGAQDVLVKPELECALLARSIRYAIERQRRAVPELRLHAKAAMLAD
jgi:DNA-binding response OmpR family regulator